MTFACPFAYNTGSTISGTEQLGSLTIGIDNLNYPSGVGGIGSTVGAATQTLTLKFY